MCIECTGISAGMTSSFHVLDRVADPSELYGEFDELLDCLHTSAIM